MEFHLLRAMIRLPHQETSIIKGSSRTPHHDVEIQKFSFKKGVKPGFFFQMVVKGLTEV